MRPFDTTRGAACSTCPCAACPLLPDPQSLGGWGLDPRQSRWRSISPVIGTKRTGITARSWKLSPVLVITLSSW